MSIINIKLNKEEELIFNKYAKLHDISLSTLFKKALEEKIEDEVDLNLYNQAMKDHEKNPQDISFDEMKKQLDLDS